MKRILRTYLALGLGALLLSSSLTSCRDSKREESPLEELGNERSKALSAPTLKLPTDQAVNEELTPTFTWTPARSWGKKSLRYAIYIGKSKELTEADLVAKDLTQPTYTPTAPLANSTTYYWQVVASDTEQAGVSQRSSIQSFSTIDPAPGVRLLLADALELGSERSIRFAWEGVNIPKEDISGKAIEPVYNLYFRYGDDHFNDAIPTRNRIKEKEATFQATRGNVTIYWKVIMFLGNDAYTSPIQSIKLGNTLPTAAVLAVPSAKLLSGGKTAGAQLRWTASVDPDKNGDKQESLTYDIYVGEQESLTADDLRQAGVETTTYELANLKLSTTYYAHVVTKDEHGAEVRSNTVRFVTPDEPTVPEGTLSITQGSWTDSRDGKQYKTVTINGKTWLAENFAYLPYLESPTDENKRCTVYGENKFAKKLGATINTDNITVESSKAHANYAKYGVMYSNAALVDVVPSGWHVPTDEEWQELERLSGMSEADLARRGTGKNNYRGITAAWFFAPNQGYTGEDLNKLQLSLMLGGYSTTFEEKGINDFTYYWANSVGVNYRAFNKKYQGILRDYHAPTAKHRMYLRLVKD